MTSIQAGALIAALTLIAVITIGAAHGLVAGAAVGGLFGAGLCLGMPIGASVYGRAYEDARERLRRNVGE